MLKLKYVLFFLALTVLTGNLFLEKYHVYFNVVGIILLMLALYQINKGLSSNNKEKQSHEF
jgi:predicted membrane protein